MTLTPDLTVAEIATSAPGTIPVFQHHHIDFCCGGREPLARVCAARGLDVDAVLAELRAAVVPAPEPANWTEVGLTLLITHIQTRYHEPLRAELPRLSAMLEKVVSRHGTHLPETLPPLQRTFTALQEELLEHMGKEDRILFPAIVALDAGGPLPIRHVSAWLAQPIEAMEAEHAAAGAALGRIRDLTSGFAPPAWACPTFRGLYYALAQLESDMHVHVFLENHVLFPRAAQLARERKN
jgi:regulator of cell morphogenesis and NO signaling